MLHTTADVETFRAAYVWQGGHLDPDPDAARFWVVSDILGFLPDPAHILAAASSRSDLSLRDVGMGWASPLPLQRSEPSAETPRCRSCQERASIIGETGPPCGRLGEGAL